MWPTSPDPEKPTDARGRDESGLDHLADEVRLLDLRIRLLLERIALRGPPKREDEFLGLVLTMESMAELAGRESNLFSTSAAEEQKHPAGADLQKHIGALETHIEQRGALSKHAGIRLPLDRLAELFALTPFERFCIVTALAPELDRKYERLFAFLQDDVTRKKPSVELAMNLFAAHPREKLELRQVFDPRGSLTRHHLVEFSEESAALRLPLPSRSFKLDDRICEFLLGQQQIDARLESFTRLMIPLDDAQKIPAADALAKRVGEFVRAHEPDLSGRSRPIVFSLCGPEGAGKRSLVYRVCSELNRPLLLCDVTKMLRCLAASGDSIDMLPLLHREGMLQESALCLADVDPLVEPAAGQRGQFESIADACRLPGRPTFLTSRQARVPQSLFKEAEFIEIPFDVRDDRSRFLLWEEVLDDHAVMGPTPISVSDSDIASLAGRFRVTPGTIRRAAGEAAALARWRTHGKPAVTMADLATACRSQSNPSFGTMATRIVPVHGWADLVLPTDATSQLRDIVDQIKYRYRVFGDWGFERKLSRGKGLSALFSGPPGTGKTLAAEIIAGALELDLYRIDLSQVVSKYIGETEKNLRQIFVEAKSCNAILFFDEADTIFARRSEVKDAHDRYANLETGYLLQQMEEYEGIAILATNLKKNIDAAFTRRLQHIVDFPFPGADQRRRIWQVMFPDQTPLARDVDFEVLAREIKLAGGNIKNIAVAAAFFAAAEDPGQTSDSTGAEIGMSHLISAAKREYQKLGMLWTDPQLTDVLGQSARSESHDIESVREARIP
jgi:winged helix domain-containing protein/ATPase family protein associated with various cellular activities (AAA)